MFCFQDDSDFEISLSDNDHDYEPKKKKVSFSPGFSWDLYDCQFIIRKIFKMLYSDWFESLQVLQYYIKLKVHLLTVS